MQIDQWDLPILKLMTVAENTSGLIKKLLFMSCLGEICFIYTNNSSTLNTPISLKLFQLTDDYRDKIQ